MKKRLRGAAYGFAHHCQSGLSFIQPHLSSELRRTSADRLEVQFLPAFSVSPDLGPETPLRRALIVAGQKLVDILAKHRIDPREIARAGAVLRGVSGSDYLSSVEVILVTTAGAEVSRRL